MGKRPTPENSPPPVPPKPAVLTLEDLGVRSGALAPQKPRLERNDPFLFFMHAERWHVLGGRVVPSLKRIPIRNGVNAIIQGPDGKFNLDKMIEVQKKKGWTMLDPMVDGEAAYLYSPAEGVWLTRWETAHAGSRVVTPDPDGFAAWLRKLIAEKRIPGPQPYVLEGLRARLESEALALKDKVRTVPSAQVDLDRKLAALDVVERELRGAGAAPVEKPASNPLAALIQKPDPDTTDPGNDPKENAS